jgi:hypothetical protein
MIEHSLEADDNTRAHTQTEREVGRRMGRAHQGGLAFPDRQVVDVVQVDVEFVLVDGRQVTQSRTKFCFDRLQLVQDLHVVFLSQSAVDGSFGSLSQRNVCGRVFVLSNQIKSNQIKSNQIKSRQKERKEE